MKDYNFLNTAIINVIKRLRKEGGLSQQKLANLSGIERLYILQLEQGKFRPTLNAIFFLAKGYGLLPQTLVELIEKERRRLEVTSHEGKCGVNTQETDSNNPF